jgi:hypothetical protein
VFGGGQRGGGRGAPPTRDNPTPSAVGSAEISGVVLLNGANTPVRRARVTLSGAELRGGRTVVSDEQGRFVFQLLPAGRFTLTASKAGYVDVAYGAKRPGRPGTPIQLAEGQKVQKLAIALPRGGVITGVVVDENGDPSPGTQVRALRVVMRTGEKSLQQVGQDQTDDRGVYRIFQLQPGDYVVSAAPRNMNPLNDVRDLFVSQAAVIQQNLSQSGGAGGLGADLGNLVGLANSPAAQQAMDRLAALQQLAAEPQQSVAYAPVYYPGTTAPSGAATVTVGVGEEKTGIDFQLQLLATAKVQGVVVSQDGTLPTGIQVALVSADRSGIPAGMGTSMARVDGTGQFTFRDVTPGQYTLQARAPIRRPVDAAANPAGGRGGPPGRGGGPLPPGQIAQVLWASTEVAVSGMDMSNLTLMLQPGMTVSGRVEFRGAGVEPPSDLTRVRVSLSPRGQQGFEMGPVPPAEVDASGRFTLAGVAPGRYAVSGGVPGAGQGGGRGGPGAPGVAGGQWTLANASIDGRDALDFPIEIGPNQNVQGMTLTFTDRTQDLSGQIQDAAGRPTADFTIIVFPTDNRYWLPQARRIVATRPGTDGTFSFRGLPIGEYRLTAVTDVEPGEWYDPTFLSQLVPASIPISLREGEKKVQDIKLAGN